MQEGIKKQSPNKCIFEIGGISEIIIFDFLDMFLFTPSIVYGNAAVLDIEINAVKDAGNMVIMFFKVLLNLKLLAIK